MSIGYKVTISKDSYKEGATNLKTVSFNPNEGFDSKEKGDAVLSTKNGNGVVNAVVANVATKAIRYGFSNYGSLFGDYINQANINKLFEIGGLIAMAATGPVGAVAAVANIGVQIVDYEIEKAKKNREAQFLRERTGMINFGRSR